MNTTELVIQIGPEKKKSGPFGIETHDLCYTGAEVSQRSWVQIPYGSEFFSGLIWSASSVVFIAVRIDFYIFLFNRSART